VKKLLARLVRDDTGATSIEYGLIAVLISVGIIIAVTTLGTQVATTFGKVKDELVKAN
jgi:pilus assembly protein Flp/PilA